MNLLEIYGLDIRRMVYSDYIMTCLLAKRIKVPTLRGLVEAAMDLNFQILSVKDKETGNMLCKVQVIDMWSQVTKERFQKEQESRRKPKERLFNPCRIDWV